MTDVVPFEPTPGPQRLVERVIEVIEAVVDAGEPVGPRGLSRRTGIDRSAVGRILLQLTDLGVLERQEDGYQAGPRLFDLARVLASLDTLPNAANSVLSGLVDRFDETCYVSVRHGDSAVFLYELQSSKPLRYVVELGRPVPLHAGAAGRAILAGLPGPVASELLADLPLRAITSATVTDPAVLLETAEADRRRGYTLSMQERVEGGGAIAAPFFDQSGRCQGSVVFTSPLSRLDRSRVDEIGSAVAAAAAALSARLGYNRVAGPKP